MTRAHGFILPDWDAPANVRAVTTTRAGGMSRGAHATFNLGSNTTDAPETVAANRRLLRARLDLAREPAWLRQVHGAGVVHADDVDAPVDADAAWTTTPGVACAVLTADCLPVLFCDRAGTQVAAAHGGWRGLAAGILERTVATFAVPRADILAWLGPAIGPAAFEVGPEVREAFTQRWPDTQAAFRRGEGDRWFADIFAIARMQLRGLGVSSVTGGGECTYSQPHRFYSFRRERETGRMASLVWLADA